MNEGIEFFGDTKLLSISNLNTSYWEINLPKTDHTSIVVTLQHCLYQLPMIALGSGNAPTTYR